MSAPLPRVRVTAPITVSAAPSSESGATESGATDGGTGDTSALYVRSLIRSQLRLAIVCAVTFAVLLVAIPIAVVVLPDLASLPVAGVPLGWVAVGVGVYPILLLVAALFVRAADRNEQRYRSLAEEQ